MKKQIHKSLSVVLTSLVIVMLVLMGPAQAINVHISDVNDITSGEDVEFNIVVDLNTPDMYLPIVYTELIFTRQGSEDLVCKVYNDGSSDCDLDAIVTFDTTYGQGNGFGYGYANGYGYQYTNFGNGYGYGYLNENGQITYQITLHNAEIGDYKVKAYTYVIREDSVDDNQGFGYCDTMYGMYDEYVDYLINSTSPLYDPELDLNEDGKIDLSDLAIFADTVNKEHPEDAQLFGRFKEFYRFRSDSTYNPELDIYPEEGNGIVDFDDFMHFALYYYTSNEAWCAHQISFIPGVERQYISNTQDFKVTEPIVNPIVSSGGSSNKKKIVVCGEGYVYNEDTNTCELTIPEFQPLADNGLGDLPEETEDEKETKETSSFSNFFSPITGAVTGVLGNNGFLIILIVLVLLIGALIGLKIRKKK